MGKKTQNEFGFVHSAAESCSVAKRMFELLSFFAHVLSDYLNSVAKRMFELLRLG